MANQTATLPNWVNRTIWTGDNLDIMRGMNSGSVDLIYLDPPFNSNRTYAAPIGSEAAGAAFKDTWTLDDVDEAWHGLVADEEPALYRIIDAAGFAHGKGMKSYLIMMSVRLLEMRRLLKPTGSIYLHCDPTASHYLEDGDGLPYSARTTFVTKSLGAVPRRTVTPRATEETPTPYFSTPEADGGPGTFSTSPTTKSIRLDSGSKTPMDASMDR